MVCCFFPPSLLKECFILDFWKEGGCCACGAVPKSPTTDGSASLSLKSKMAAAAGCAQPFLPPWKGSLWIKHLRSGGRWLRRVRCCILSPSP